MQMEVKCGCGRKAEYAVYNPTQPHCLSCMLEAVDCALSVPVRTLDPWETIMEPKPSTYHLFNRRNIQC